jgi:hypothetical protein
MASGDFYPGLTEDEYEEMLRRHFGGNVAPEVREPANDPAPAPPGLSGEEKQKLNETMVASWVKSFSDIFLHPESDLEKKSTSPRLPEWTREAARRVLEARKARRIDRPPLPADDFVRAEEVTFEDLENQYKAQKLAPEMEKGNQQILNANSMRSSG